MSKPSRPCFPPESHTSRGTMPSFSHCAWKGAIVFSAQPRTIPRNSSCPASYREWRMLPSLPDRVPRSGAQVRPEPVDGELAGGRRRWQRAVLARERVDAEHELHRICRRLTDDGDRGAVDEEGDVVR